MTRRQAAHSSSHAFAELAVVTVRALHSYDRLGLLKPRRGSNGYRSYTDRDVARLEQIVVLKLIGLPLKDIRVLLAERAALRPYGERTAGCSRLSSRRSEMQNQTD